MKLPSQELEISSASGGIGAVRRSGRIGRRIIRHARSLSGARFDIHGTGATSENLCFVLVGTGESAMLGPSVGSCQAQSFANTLQSSAVPDARPAEAQSAASPGCPCWRFHDGNFNPGSSTDPEFPLGSPSERSYGVHRRERFKLESLLRIQIPCSIPENSLIRSKKIPALLDRRERNWANWRVNTEETHHR